MSDPTTPTDDIPEASTGPRPTFTVSGAAKATGRSRRTIGRMLDAGELVGATRDESGAWSIPVEALLGAGLAVHAPSPAPEPSPPTMPTPTPTPAPVGTPTTEDTELRAELADAQHRAELERTKRLAAEERAATAEADRDRWAEQAAALAARMLPATTEPQTPDDLGSPRGEILENPAQKSGRVRWWNRR